MTLSKNECTNIQSMIGRDLYEVSNEEIMRITDLAKYSPREAFHSARKWIKKEMIYNFIVLSHKIRKEEVSKMTHNPSITRTVGIAESICKFINVLSNNQSHFKRLEKMGIKLITIDRIIKLAQTSTKHAFHLAKDHCKKRKMYDLYSVLREIKY